MTHQVTLPFAHTSGPRNARLMIVGEAWGEQEEKLKLPFIGSSGQELTRLLAEVGINRMECLLTNVLPLRPPQNKLDALCGSKAEVGKHYLAPPIKTGAYLREEFLPERLRLLEEIRVCNPNLIIAAGNLACWALLGMTSISKIRGSTAQITLGSRPPTPGFPPYYKVLPTFHPAYVLRAWHHRVIVSADLTKAAYEMTFPEIRRPEREVLVNPTLDEIEAWISRPMQWCSTDIETHRGQIEMIGLARSPREALVVPFFRTTKIGKVRVFTGNYWKTPAEEVAARRLVGRPLADPNVKKLFQNGLYDMQYIWREGFKMENVSDDAMLLHHSMFPEMQKGLGFLGSIYTNEASWKLMHNDESQKRDE